MLLVTFTGLAEECGLEVATYYEGSWSNEHVFTGSYGPCLTNYAAIFNGKSSFRRKQVAALILDDAHVAGPSIRQAFTLRLGSMSKATAVASRPRGKTISIGCIRLTKKFSLAFHERELLLFFARSALERLLEPVNTLLDQWDKIVPMANNSAGFRASGSMAWIKDEQDMADFAAYEDKVHMVINNSRITAVCTYPTKLATMFPARELPHSHNKLLVKRGEWVYEKVKRFQGDILDF